MEFSRGSGGRKLSTRCIISVTGSSAQMEQQNLQLLRAKEQQVQQKQQQQKQVGPRQAELSGKEHLATDKRRGSVFSRLQLLESHDAANGAAAVVSTTEHRAGGEPGAGENCLASLPWGVLSPFGQSSLPTMQGGCYVGSSSGRRVLTIADVQEAAEELKESLVLKMKRENTPRLHAAEVESLTCKLPPRAQQVIQVSKNSKG